MAKLKEPDQLPLIAQQTKVHIWKDSRRFPERQCENCGGRHFQIHQCRGRWFLLVLESLVYPLRCMICRWLCVFCETTFTQLPSGCLPHKRYLRIEIETRVCTYIETDSMTYRRVARDHGSDVVYAGPVADAHSAEAQKEAEYSAALAPSTVYRWIGSIASHRERYQPVVARAHASGRGSRISTLVVSPTKYRSDARRVILEACGLLLRALSLIGIRNPTKFAILGSSP